ncbi:MAG: CotH kinase family protein [Defluviitaleaceae bacterium]|nr:CotH kinase family protein [Defluviitaleaceae bacterium]MCL2239823.1 CotH kinase family protein [Defluviitaleaceae bacterium]
MGDKLTFKRLLVLLGVAAVLVGTAVALPWLRGRLRPPRAPSVLAEGFVVGEVLPVDLPPRPEGIYPPLMPEGVFDFPSLHIYSALHPFAPEREFWHDGTVAISGTAEPFLMESTPVRIRGRGASTWAYGPEKRPLRLRFAQPQRVLDSPAEATDWVLIANLFDLTLLRNHLAFFLAGTLEGMCWAPFSRLVHVYINGEYVGVYQLADERDTSPGRASGDFLIEIDGGPAVRDAFIRRGDIEGVDFLFMNNWAISVRHPHRRERTHHMHTLRHFLTQVDTAIQSHDYARIAALVDIPSFIDYYLLQEWFKNIDISNRSIFMQIRGSADAKRLYFGPVWDFDRSSANMGSWYQPEHIFAGHYNVWFADMLQVPEIHARAATRWHEIRASQIPGMTAYAQYLILRYAEAFHRNFEKHDHIFGGYPDWFRLISEKLRTLYGFRPQAEYLLFWLEARAVWLDGYFSPQSP